MFRVRLPNLYGHNQVLVGFSSIQVGTQKQSWDRSSIGDPIATFTLSLQYSTTDLI